MVEEAIADMIIYGYYLFAKYKNGRDETFCVFKPKYDVDITHEVYEKYGGLLYYITRIDLIDEIKKKGLTPKIKKEEIDDRFDKIYFSYNKNTVTDFVELKKIVDNYSDYILLTVKMDENSWPLRKFYHDKQIIDSVYTLENIPSQWIVEIEEI
jgi:dimeric dUTPase (all-alpha-NTP-PPase superfamily)